MTVAEEMSLLKVSGAGRAQSAARMVRIAASAKIRIEYMKEEGALRRLGPRGLQSILPAVDVR